LFTVSVETHFWASHQLTLSDGSKEPVHQHNWSVAAEVSRGKLNRVGLVMDFSRLRAMVDDIVAELDNTLLDRINYFQKKRSSAESVARYVYEKLEPRLPKGVKLNHIRVIEEPGCLAKFGK